MADNTLNDLYDNKADSSNHRRATEVILAATEKEGFAPIVTFCPYAGKPGRPRPYNNYNKEVPHAILSGTVLWLVCPFVNNMIARLERSGGVKAVDARLKEEGSYLGSLFEASHRVYESYVTTVLLKDPSEQMRFLKMFVTCGNNNNNNTTNNNNNTNNDITSSGVGAAAEDGANAEPSEAAGEKASNKGANWNRKYGNAGVNSPRDLKCFHAVAAQSLGGASNPVGNAVVMYLFHLYDVLRMMEDEARMAADTDDQTTAAAAAVDKEDGAGDNRTNADVADTNTDSKTELVSSEKGEPNEVKAEEGGKGKGEREATADSSAAARRTFAGKISAFASYVDNFANFEAFLNKCVDQKTLSISEDAQQRLPELTSMSKEMLLALEGHQPYHRKKRRIH